MIKRSFCIVFFLMLWSSLSFGLSGYSNHKVITINGSSAGTLPSGSVVPLGYARMPIRYRQGHGRSIQRHTGTGHPYIFRKCLVRPSQIMLFGLNFAQICLFSVDSSLPLPMGMRLSSQMDQRYSRITLIQPCSMLQGQDTLSI